MGILLWSTLLVYPISVPYFCSVMYPILLFCFIMEHPILLYYGAPYLGMSAFFGNAHLQLNLILPLLRAAL